MDVALTISEYRAINDLRGLTPDAHMLVMTSRSTETGGVLDGSEHAFGELVEFISGELADGMVRGSAVNALVSACVKIDPDCANWLGQ